MPDGGAAVERARALAESFRSGAGSRDASRVYPDEQVDALKQSGLLALFVPEEHGGLAADYRTATEVFATIAEADPNLAHIPQAHHCAVELLKITPDQRVTDWLFPKILSGALVSSAYVDRGHQRKIDDVAGATLEHRYGNWRLNGAKFYVTGSRWADVLYGPVTVTGEIPAGVLPAGATKAVVWLDADTPGIRVEDDWDGMGQRLTASGSVVFEDVDVAPDRIIPDDLAPESLDNYYGSHAQILFCAIQLGIARAALSDTLHYVNAAGRPWIHSGVSSATQDPYILHHVGELDVLVEGAAALLDRAADALDACRAHRAPARRDIATVAVARAKIATTEAAIRTTNELFRICGTRSTRSQWGFDRHWRNARTLTLHDPVDYKYRLIGDYLLNGTPPPISGWT